MIVWLTLIGGLLIIVVGYGAVWWVLRDQPPEQPPTPPEPIDVEALALLRQRVRRG